jgi:hypothetical protein
LKLFPNPTEDIVLIETEQPIESIEVFNINGNKLNEIRNSNQVSLQGLRAGVYFLKIHSNKGSINKKILKR